MEEKISIVMPVYNTGKYLEEALDSLANQTFRDFQVFCVNDASQDEVTNGLLKAYEAKDDRIHVIWLQENVGAAEARNIGFSKAQGEYVIFLDADDIFRENMLEEMYQKIRQEDAEVCYCAYRAFYIENGKKILSFEQRPSIYDQREEFFCDAISTAWTKLCKRSFLLENHIYFQSTPSQNDVFFSYMVYLKSGRQCKCDKHLVEYRTKNPNQITAKADKLYFFKAVELTLASIKGDEKEPLYRKQLILKVLIHANQYISELTDSDRKAEYYAILQQALKKNKDVAVYKKKVYNYYVKKVLTEDYDGAWFDFAFTYEALLEFYTSEIVDRLHGYQKILLWGNGKRGQAFQKICRENHLNLTSVSDTRNENVGEKTSYGYEIVHTDKAFHETDVIVASNFFVYHQLLEQKNKLPIINLEEYC